MKHTCLWDINIPYQYLLLHYPYEQPIKCLYDKEGECIAPSLTYEHCQKLWKEFEEQMKKIGKTKKEF